MADFGTFRQHMVKSALIQLILPLLPLSPRRRMVGLDQTFRESTIAETTSTVEELTGKPPRSLTEWLTDNLNVFRA